MTNKTKKQMNKAEMKKAKGGQRGGSYTTQAETVRDRRRPMMVWADDGVAGSRGRFIASGFYADDISGVL